MRHGVKKIKAHKGQDATQMLLRKLSYNFITKGKIISTLKRIKILKREIEILVGKAKNTGESSHNFLLSKLGHMQTINFLKDVVAPVFKDRVGGYVRIVKLTQRGSDGAEVASLEWVSAVPYAKEAENKREKPVKEAVKKEAVSKKINVSKEK